MTTNALKCKCKPDNEITVSSNITATIIDTMTTSSATTILDLPIELIEQICCYDSLKLIDVFNLAVSHPKLNNCLLGEPNSCLWKSKFIQKYGPLDKDEYEVVIDDQNSWKDEIMLRMGLEKSIFAEIVKMSFQFMKFKIIPYHMYPYSQYINSNKEGHRYYILTAVAAFYEQQLSFNKNYDLLYNAHQLLIYSCQVYFGYKLRHFLSLPPSEQIVERGFCLLGRWWSPRDNTPYRDINKSLNNLAINVWNHIRLANPAHPLFNHENSLNRLVECGRNNLDHDLFDQTSTLFILNKICQIIISDFCLCTNDFNCYLLQQVIDERKGSVILLCVIFESVARRLGVKVHLTETSDPVCVYWSSSWPGNKHAPTRYLVDIARGGIIYKDTVFKVSRQLSKYYNGNYLPNLFWGFGKTIGWLTSKNIVTRKYLLDFRKILRPDDSMVELRCQQFHKYYCFCRCPLLRDPSNQNAPKHEDEMNIFYLHWEDIFPLVPKKRGEIQDPKYSIGMMIEISTKSNAGYPPIVTQRGVVVGWSRLTCINSLPDPTVYHVLIRPHPYVNPGLFLNPVVSPLRDGRYETLQRQLKPLDYSFENIGKFFTHYSQELCAFMPINDLARLYPDDLSYTISQSMSIDCTNK